MSLSTWSIIFFLFTFVTSTPLKGTPLLPRGDPPPRDLWVFMYTYTPSDDAPLEVDPEDGQYYLATHSGLMITGTETDGSVLVEIVDDNLYSTDPNAEEEMQVRTTMRDPLPPGQDTTVPDWKTNSYVTRALYKVDGQVPWTNEEIMDVDSGLGIIWDSWKSNTVYAATDNNCHTLVRNILAQAQLVVPEPVNEIMTDDQRYQQLVAARSPTGQLIDGGIKFEMIVGNKRIYEQWSITGDSTNPTLSAPQEFDQEPTLTYADTDPNPKDQKINLENQENIDPQTCTRRRGLDKRQSCSSLSTDQTTEVDKLQAVASSDSDIVYARSKGIVTIVQAFTKDIASAAGVAGAALAPVFILLDLVNGDFKSAAFGLVGAALGLAVSFGGPIGFAIGAVLAVLFAILPGLFDHPDINPPANNATEVSLLDLLHDRD
jgi:hypothetical protein